MEIISGLKTDISEEYDWKWLTHLLSVRYYLDWDTNRIVLYKREVKCIDTYWFPWMVRS